MEILYLLIPVSLVIAALAVGIFFWAVKSGQYDDLEGPAWRILFDDEPRARNGDEGEPVKVGEGSNAGEDSPKSGAVAVRTPAGHGQGQGPERDGP